MKKRVIIILALIGFLAGCSTRSGEIMAERTKANGAILLMDEEGRRYAVGECNNQGFCFVKPIE